MRRRYFVLILISLIMSVCIYYLVEIIIERITTPLKVKYILNSDLIILQLTDLSQRQLDILLAVEDPNFYNHKGVDLKTPGAGITTITQALVKKLYFRDFKPGIRKIKQTLIAYFVLDRFVSKDDQLLLFINIFDFGFGTKGLCEAAQFFFNKPFGEISEDEYLSLVAMYIGCRHYCPIRNPEANAERVARIKKLISGEYIPKGMKDVYYDQDRNAFRMKNK